MSDNEYCSALHKLIHTALNYRFGTGINGGSRLVKDHYGRIGNCGSCYSYELTLALGQIGAVICKLCIVTVRKS